MEMDQDIIGGSLNLECERFNVYILYLLRVTVENHLQETSPSRCALDLISSCLSRDITAAIIPFISCCI